MASVSPASSPSFRASDPYSATPLPLPPTPLTPSSPIPPTSPSNPKELPKSSFAEWIQTPMGRCVISIIGIVFITLLSGAAGAIMGVTAGGFTGGLIVGGIASAINIVGSVLSWSVASTNPQLGGVIGCITLLAVLFITPAIAGPMFGVFGMTQAISYGRAFVVLLAPISTIAGVVCCYVSCLGARGVKLA